jgi:hypothetical protein
MAIKANFTGGLLSVTGDNGNDDITVTRNAAGQILVNGDTVFGDGSQSRVDNTTEIDVFGGNGNDTISLDNLAPALPPAHLFGGNGNDTLNGGAGNDILDGGNGNDTVAGGKGNDMASLGAGNDTFIWNNGDGSDVVEGQAGFDTLVFNGNGDAKSTETITISAHDGRATLFRTQGSVTMDLNSVERIELNALGGADNITVNDNDLTGTDVKEVAIDLGADDQADTVNIATNGQAITVTDNNGMLTVSGLASTLTISNFDTKDNDQLFINGKIVPVTEGQTVTVDAVSSDNTSGTSTESDGSRAAALLGQFMASSFVTAGDGHGATPIADQPATQQQPLLAQPHA